MNWAQILFLALLILANTTDANDVSFSKNEKALPVENKNLRQWESPVVADLDQDGWPDLLLNDHGFSVRLIWNNQGKFAKPYDLIMGDMHGVAVGDYDNDGLMEVVISRGGGSGSNSRNSLIFEISKKRQIARESDFDEPLAFMRGRTVKFVDLDLDGDLDLLNFAFPSKDKKGKSENYLYENRVVNGRHQMVHAGFLPSVFSDGQKTLVTYINDDKLPDLVLYGDDQLAVYQNQGGFKFIDVTTQVLPEKYKKVTNVVNIDVDNDGDLDLFFTRSNELKPGDTFYNKEKKLLGFFNKRGVKRFPPFTAGDVIDLVNFQSQWPHKSLYLGESAYEYQYPGETHSGRDVRLVNSDVLGFPEELNDKGLYIGYIGNRQWQLVSSSWAPMSGVISGIEKFEASGVNFGVKDVLLLNTNGKYQVAAQDNFRDLIINSQDAVVADIDNNGWQDILITRRGDLVNENKSIVYLNQGKGKFAVSSTHGISTNDLGSIGMGVAIVDHNLDGALDVVLGNERGRWHLFTNDGNNNNYLSVNLIKSNNSANETLSSEVTVVACGIHQTKYLLNTSAPYSQSSDTSIHFGLGNCNKDVNLLINSNNNDTVEKTVAVNQNINIYLK